MWKDSVRQNDDEEGSHGERQDDCISTQLFYLGAFLNEPYRHNPEFQDYHHEQP